MALTVSNRELLRNYKSLRNKLVQNKVKVIRVEQKGGTVLEIRIKREKKQQSAFQHSLELIYKYKIKDLKRPEADFYDYI